MQLIGEQLGMGSDEVDATPRLTKQKGESVDVELEKHEKHA